MKSVIGSLLILGVSMVQAANHVVVLGQGGALKFVPDQVIAAVGDTVEFQFAAGNHSVAQSSFAAPCVPLAKGIWSGFEFVSKPAAASATAGAAAATTSQASSGYSYMQKRQSSTIPTFTITINNTTPLWFYCAQAKHCQNGMVMAINVNATSNKTLAAFQQLAAAAPSNLPGLVVEGGLQGQAAAASGAAGAGASGVSTSTPSSAASSGNSIVVSGTAFIAMFLVTLFGGFMAV